MSETLFPARTRCKSCRKALGANNAPVLRGLYCSPKCAGVTAPSPDPEHPNTPRECRTQYDGKWVFKRRYRSVAEIPARISDDPSTSSYWCGHCGHLHVGRTLVELPRAQNRGLRNRSDLADLLVKARGHATHKQVGDAAGIRPIRVKEWEDASNDSPSLLALFGLLRVYRLDLAAVFR
ncbi:MAG TPA: hypothetical protein VFU07_05190 [Candidatus Lumbricidophila sp.]|nr:hypothetical protein [Candidatus Lumbricidophila sp.]